MVKNIKQYTLATKVLDHKETQLNKCKLAIVEGATGSGKTHLAILTTIKIVLEGCRIAILAFPNLKLLIQTNELIKKI